MSLICTVSYILEKAAFKNRFRFPFMVLLHYSTFTFASKSQYSNKTYFTKISWPVLTWECCAQSCSFVWSKWWHTHKNLKPVSDIVKSRQVCVFSENVSSILRNYFKFLDLFDQLICYDTVVYLESSNPE